jgi:hypothetical protein
MRSEVMPWCAVIATVFGCSAFAPRDSDADAPGVSTHDAGRPNPSSQAGSASGNSAVLDAGATSSVPSSTGEAPTDWPDGGYELVSDRDRCALEPVAQGFVLAPYKICDWTPMRDRRICSTAPAVECFRASDCTEEPLGRCEGSTSTQCNYPHRGSACTVDTDCIELPDGVCIPALSGELFCDEQGNNCARLESLCHYRVLNRVCTTDAECDAAPGGACIRAVVLTRCIYLGCEGDGDCGAGEVCACHECVTAECQSDGECGSGEICRRENGCGWGPSGGFHCTEPGDECRSDDDCQGGAYCDFDRAAGRFFCDSTICEVP